MLVTTHDELIRIFFGQNVKLISDVWAPILDVVPDGFLLKPENMKWTEYFTRVTKHILAHNLTALFKLASPAETIHELV